MSSKKLFSFDIGTNSIGWAVFELDADSDPYGIVDAGVRIFSDGREPKSGTSLAEGRRNARAMARRRDRYLRRRKALLRTLTEYGLMPEDTAARKRLIGETNDRGIGQAVNNVYALRARALDEELSPFHIGRVLFHLNQRRGFKSNRKTDRRDNDAGKIAVGISRLQRAMDAEGARTLGEYLALRRAQGEWVRVRVDANLAEAATIEGGEPEKSAYDFYPARSLLEDEFHRIWDAQQTFHPDLLPEERREHLYRVMFYQRPLKPARVGKCSFNPQEFRLTKAHPLFQLFRLYKEVNELAVIDEHQSSRKLTLEERDLAVQQLRSKRDMTFAQIRRLLKLTSGSRLNKESESRAKMKGDEVYAELADKKRFGNRWGELPLDRRWAIVERLRETEDPLALRAWLESNCGLTEEQAEAVMGVRLPAGYGRLGPTAIGTMLEELKADVIVEAEAAKRAGYDHALLGRGDAHDELPKYQEVLARRIPPGSEDPDDPYDIRKGRITNPTVHIGLNQLQRVMNRLIAHYGRPEQIAIELARELKLNEEEKRRKNAEIARNTRDAERRSQKLLELGQSDNGYNRVLLKLWEELNPDQPEDRRCIYSGMPISLRMLFSGEVDVDHILPWSQTLDDSQANRILCMTEANREKGNRAPADVPQWQGRYDEILERATRLPRNKQWRFARDAMERFEKERDFLARQMTDTQYLSRLAHEYIGSLYEDEEPDEWGVFSRRNHVRVIPGRLTAMLRRRWGLNNLLPDHNYDDVTKEKNRKDHRHHAIDAAVVGVTTRSLLQKIATAAGRGEAVGDENALREIDPPWPGFRDDLKAALDRIVVSHKPDHGTLPKPGMYGQTAGQLHNDTAYGLTGEVDEKGNTIVVRRKPLTSLTPKDIPAIRDTDLQAALYSVMGSLSGEELTQALLHFRHNPGQHRQFKGIRRVRMTEPLRVIPIRDREGRAYKGYKGDANYRYDVWELADGRWIAEVVTMFNAHQPTWTSNVLRQHHNPRKVLSLHQNDMVAYEHPVLGPTIGTVVKFGVNGQLTLVPHKEAGDLKRRDAMSNDIDPFKYYAPTAGGLKKLKLRQVRVDEIGRVFDPGPQDRESRNARNSTVKVNSR
ncbi:MAG: type II CRISPR RNA-guided endonuclease Cas9 [Rhizobiaceae bacterium]